METLNVLSNRELQITGMVARGFASKEIADKLCLSTHTVRTHMKNIFRKTGARKATDIVRAYTLEHGFESPVFNAKNNGTTLFSRLLSRISKHKTKETR